MTTAAIQTPAIPAGVTFSHRDILGFTVDCPGISECGRAFTLGMWSATLAHLDDALVRDPDYNYEHHSDPVEIPTQWAPSCVSGMISEGLGWMAEHAAALQVVGVPPVVVAGFLGVCYGRARSGQHQDVSLEWLGQPCVWDSLLALDWWPLRVSMDGSTILWEE